MRTTELIKPSTFHLVTVSLLRIIMKYFKFSLHLHFLHFLDHRIDVNMSIKWILWLNLQHSLLFSTVLFSSPPPLETATRAQCPLLVGTVSYSKSAAAIVLATKEQSQQSWNIHTGSTKESMLPFVTDSVCYFRTSTVATPLLLLLLTMQFKLTQTVYLFKSARAQK